MSGVRSKNESGGPPPSVQGPARRRRGGEPHHFVPRMPPSDSRLIPGSASFRNNDNAPSSPRNATLPVRSYSLNSSASAQELTVGGLVVVCEATPAAHVVDKDHGVVCLAVHHIWPAMAVSRVRLLCPFSRTPKLHRRRCCYEHRAWCPSLLIPNPFGVGTGRLSLQAKAVCLYARRLAFPCSGCRAPA